MTTTPSPSPSVAAQTAPAVLPPADPADEVAAAATGFREKTVRFFKP